MKSIQVFDPALCCSTGVWDLAGAVEDAYD